MACSRRKLGRVYEKTRSLGLVATASASARKIPARSPEGGFAEGVIRRDETIPRESLRVNDRVRAYIFDVREEPRGPQIFLSRSHPQFMAKLFTQEVP